MFNIKKIINNENYTLSILYLGKETICNEELIINYLKNLTNENIFEILSSIKDLSGVKLEKELELRIIKKTGECLYIHFIDGKLVNYIHYVVIDGEVYNISFKNNLIRFNFIDNPLYSNISLSKEVNKELSLLKRVLKK